jgi:hypothetical protein
MIPIGVYKRHDEQTTSQAMHKFGKKEGDNQAEGLSARGEEKTQRKSYVWLHPPKKIELNIYDQIFVLGEKSLKEN